MTQLDLKLKETKLSIEAWQRQSSIQEKDNISSLKKLFKVTKADLMITNTYTVDSQLAGSLGDQ